MSWEFENGCAHLTSENGSFEVEPTEPLKPARLSTGAGRAPWNLFALQPLPSHSFSVEESYVRGADLITTFDQGEGDTFAFQINFRRLTGEDFGVELWTSVQTDDLDREPVMKVSCQSPAGEYWDILNHGDVLGSDVEGADSTPAALVARCEQETGVWLVEPSDQRHADLLSSPAEPEQRLELFGHFMEKGVIRRARMRFHLIAGELTDAKLKELYLDFSQSELPLTA